MSRLVVAHRSHDRQAFRVGVRQFVHVTGQMFLDLPLGLDDETQVDPVAGQARRDADRKRTRVPERVEQRRAVVQFREPRLCPRQVILLLARRAGESRADVRVARHQRLCRIQRLRAHLAGVIDAHQPGGVALLFRRELRQREIGAGNRAGRRRRPGECAQGAVETHDKLIDHREMLPVRARIAG